MDKSKLYKLTNLIMKIKSYVVTGASVLGIILGIIFIANGKKIVNDSNNLPSSSPEEAAANCSASLGGGILQVLGILLIIFAIAGLVIGLVYLIISRKMKKLEGVSNTPTITLFVFEVLSVVSIIVTLLILMIQEPEVGVIITLSIGVVQCVATSIMLGNLLNYKITKEIDA